MSTLHGMGFDEKLIGKVAGIMDKAGFDTVTDRSVLSSMRVVQHDLEPLLIEEGDVMNLDPVAVSCKFSHRPAAVRGRWIWPDLCDRYGP